MKHATFKEHENTIRKTQYINNMIDDLHNYYVDTCTELLKTENNYNSAIDYLEYLNDTISDCFMYETTYISNDENIYNDCELYRNLMNIRYTYETMLKTLAIELYNDSLR